MKQRVLSLVVGLLLSSLVMSKEPTTQTLQTPEGPVTTTTTDMPAFPQEIRAADREVIDAFSTNAAQGVEFVASYLPGVNEPSLKDFDDAFRIWQREKRKRYSPDDVVEIMGAVLGTRLAADFDMEWVVVTDQYGTDYAVRSKEFEVLSFPFSSVMKRIEADQYDFMVGVYHAMKATLAEGPHQRR